MVSDEQLAEWERLAAEARAAIDSSGKPLCFGSRGGTYTSEHTMPRKWSKRRRREWDQLAADVGCRDVNEDADPEHGPFARFAANAFTAVPALVAEVRRLRAAEAARVAEATKTAEEVWRGIEAAWPAEKPAIRIAHNDEDDGA